MFVSSLMALLILYWDFVLYVHIHATLINEDVTVFVFFSSSPNSDKCSYILRCNYLFGTFFFHDW